VKYFAYLISEGFYSGYEVVALAFHGKQFTEEEMNKIIKETQDTYIAKHGKPEDYGLDTSKRDEIFYKILRDKGFKIIYAIGEFSLGDYGKLNEMSADAPWIDKKTEPSMLRLGF